MLNPLTIVKRSLSVARLWPPWLILLTSFLPRDALRVPMNKIDDFLAYWEPSKRFLCAAAPRGHAENLSKKIQGVPEDKKRAGSKNFWRNLGKALGPLSGHPRKILIHAQLWLKSAAHYPLNRKIKSPKMPPSGSRGFFSYLGILGWCTVHPDQVWSKSDNLHQCGVYHWQLEYLLKIKPKLR